MTTLRMRSWRDSAVAVAGVCAAVGAAMAAGPDVAYTDCISTWNFGNVGGVQGYALASYTCNLGTTNLVWASQGTPGLAMNAYRLNNGRLEQIGMGWVKMACCAAASNFCGMTCNGASGSLLGVGCRDSYTASYNGGQNRLAPRSGINPYTGTFSQFATTSGNAIFKRLQIAATDLQVPNSLYFIEGVYATADELAPERLNNASYKRVTVTGANDLTVQGAMAPYKPAIWAWREHGLGVGVEDPSVAVTNVDVPAEGRFVAAAKVTALPGGTTWRYEYAVFNLNSDKAGGSFSVPVGPGVQVTNVGFHHVPYHSGEPYDPAPWTGGVSGGAVTWSSPQTYAQNQNSNALRWGMMYNYWFETNTPPQNGTVTLGLFKPHTPSSVSWAAQVPGQGCRPDVNHDGAVDPADVALFVNTWSASVAAGNLDGDYSGDGVVDPTDVAQFVNEWFAVVSGGPC